MIDHHTENVFCTLVENAIRPDCKLESVYYHAHVMEQLR